MRPTKPKQTFDPKLFLSEEGKRKPRTDYHKSQIVFSQGSPLRLLPTQSANSARN